MAFVKTTFQPRDKLPASKINEMQDALVHHQTDLANKTKAINQLQQNSIKSVNGATPDENGNVQIEVGDVNEEQPKIVSVGVRKVDNNIVITTPLDDGSESVTAIALDANERPSEIIIDETMHKAHKNQPMVGFCKMPAPTKLITNARDGNVENAIILSQSFFVIL
jgi:hypothetical protein